MPEYETSAAQAGSLPPIPATPDSPGFLIHAAGLPGKDTFHLGVGYGQPHVPANLLFCFIDAPDHAELQAAAGSGVGNTVIRPHMICRPAADIHERE